MTPDYGARFGRSDADKNSTPKKYAVTGGRRPNVGAGVVSRELFRQNIQSRIDDIPTLPTAVVEILKLLSNPRAGLRNFETALAKDQVLTARLIKLANSTFYGTSRRITAVKEVILRLGLLSVRSLVLAASTSQILNRPMPGYGFKEGGMWEHSLATAMAARRVARLAGLDNTYTEESFLAGLLHDIGKVVLAEDVFKQSAKFIALSQTKGILFAEEDIFGLTHVATGAMIAERWRFSEELGEAIRGHHDPDSLHRKPTENETTRMKASNSSTILRIKDLRSTQMRLQDAERIVPPLVDLAHVGNALAQQMNIGMNEDNPLPPEQFSTRALERLKITEEHLRAIEGDLLEEFNQMSVMFKGTGGDATEAKA
jgi:putative nucleotidyltransferase with HDIG domain